jgi:RNA recognition motif-containing protein
VNINTTMSDLVNYASSRRHRFPEPDDDRYFDNATGPRNTLHISNIPQSTRDEEIGRPFSAYAVKSVQRLAGRNRYMAHVEMSSVDDAVAAIAEKHNKVLFDSHSRIKISFACKKPAAVDP